MGALLVRFCCGCWLTCSSRSVLACLCTGILHTWGGLQSVSLLVVHQACRGDVVSLIRNILGGSSIGEVIIVGYPHRAALIPRLALLKVS